VAEEAFLLESDSVTRREQARGEILSPGTSAGRTDVSASACVAAAARRVLRRGKLEAFEEQ